MTITQAVATREQGPSSLVTRYRDDFASVLPSHVKPDTWVRLATGALRRDPKLAAAAQNDVAAFLGALLTAARLGLEPGTEQFYLVPRRERGVEKVMGIVGYQGQIELMYRAGTISSVVAECVYSSDHFTYRPGIDERPQHEIDWDAEDRGDLRLAYAYAVLKDGATSKVVVLNRHDINRIKKSSQGADSQYSPWVQHEPAMWLKSAVRQLAKWVPTSAEYAAERQRAQVAVTATAIPAAPAPADDEPLAVNETTGEVLEGEIIEEPPGWERS